MPANKKNQPEKSIQKDNQLKEQELVARQQPQTQAVAKPAKKSLKAVKKYQSRAHKTYDDN